MTTAKNIQEQAAHDNYMRWYLPTDMKNTGSLFEHAGAYMSDEYSVKIDQLNFLNAYIVSDTRRMIDGEHPKLLYQSYKDTIDDFIMIDCNNDPAKYSADSSTAELFLAENQLYWCGWIYCYVSRELNMPFRELNSILTLPTLLDKYYIYHEADKQKFLEDFESTFKQLRLPTPQRYGKFWLFIQLLCCFSTILVGTYLIP